MADKPPSTAQPATTPATQGMPSVPTLHPTLVPELLGFSPQMLLDDIISAAADAILQCLQAMEPFMQRWADARVAVKNANVANANGSAQGNGNKNSNSNSNAEDDWDGSEAVEQGLVAFQTLLEAHTDIAFDFFEAWSLRNIFAIPPDLPVVAPHQRGLDLDDTRPGEETELMTDIEDLRRKIENQRRLRRAYQKTLRISRVGRARSERRLARLAYLSPSSSSSTTTTSTTTTTLPANANANANALEALRTLPTSAIALFESAAALPHLEGLAASLPPTSTLPGDAIAGAGVGAGAGAARRPWESGEQGYVAWAVAQLLARARESASASAESRNNNGVVVAVVGSAAGGSTAVGDAAAQADAVGQLADVKGLAEEVKSAEEEEEKQNEGNEESMDIS